MKRTKRALVFILIAPLVIIVANYFYLTSLAAKETYPTETFFSTEQNKTALIIVAHDDDAVSAAGTITMLCKNGWKVSELCFYRGFENKDSIRKYSLQKAGEIEGLKSITTINLKYRMDTATNHEPWMPFPYYEFPNVFKTDSIEKYIINFIDSNKPAVIFTLDDAIGGYGHPEHVLISKLVRSCCEKNKTNKNFTVHRIYQAVFPPSLTENILGDNKTFTVAKKIYQCTGMPAPDIQVNIRPFASQKKEVMKAYITEQKSINMVWPYYSYYPPSIYFHIFDREFFRVIEIKK